MENTEIRNKDSVAFCEYCKKLNEKCIAAQKGEKEIVTEENAFIATVINRSLKPIKAGDFLLFAAALNVLNTYVKQDNNKKSYGYYFKKNAEVFARLLCETEIPEIRIDLQQSWGMPYLLVDIAGIQCSFHQIPVEGEIALLEEKHKQNGGNLFEFDGVKKQMCANTLLLGALENIYLREDRTIFDDNLNDELETFLNLYRNGDITLSQIRFLHKNGKSTSQEFIKNIDLR